MNSLKEIAKILKNSERVNIFCHIRPDGDTLGSAAALRAALLAFGAEADIYCDDSMPDKFGFLIEGCVSGTEDIKQGRTCVFVDCSEPSRVGRGYDRASKERITVNIDHHISNLRYAKYNYVRDCAATCEIIYELLAIMQAEITEDIANYLMLGISTDTGNFSHKNVTPETFFVAGKLAEKGADINRINYEMFKRQSAARALLHGKTMSGMRFFKEGKIALITVTEEMMKECAATPDMTEGFIDFPLSVDGVEVAVCAMQVRDKSFKISFRSKGTDVNKIAAVFGGGGHALASGCMINGFKEDVEEKLIFTIKNYL